MDGRPSFLKIKPLLEAIEDDAIEGAVNQISGYVVSCMRKAKTDAEALRFWKLLDVLTFPTETYDKRVAFYTKLGRMIWGQQ